jgi:hypothetical protein
MKFMRTAAIAALLSCSLMTPASALPVSSPSIEDASGMTPDQICQSQLKPDERSGFTSKAKVTGTSSSDGVPYKGSEAGPKSGYGTVTLSNVFLTSGFWRNGGSPNVWGGATARKTWDQTQQLFNMLKDVTTTVTYDCYVSKNPGGDNGPDEIAPPGLQSTGNTSITVDKGVAAGQQNIITEDDFIIDNASGYALACISPNNVTKAKPGEWVGKNGMTGADCHAAQLAGAFANLNSVPSNNAPDQFVAN